MEFELALYGLMGTAAFLLTSSPLVHMIRRTVFDWELSYVREFMSLPQFKWKLLFYVVAGVYGMILLSLLAILVRKTVTIRGWEKWIFCAMLVVFVSSACFVIKFG